MAIAEVLLSSCEIAIADSKKVARAHPWKQNINKFIIEIS
jgi:hypothetical protein